MTDPREERPTGRGEQDRSKQKATNAEEPKGMRMARKEKELRKPQKVTASAQREDPVAEGTGDSTEAEELPETNRKNQEQEGQAEKRQETSQRTTTGKPGRSATRETPERETPPNQKTQEKH